jgi:hypothetical protein
MRRMPVQLAIAALVLVLAALSPASAHAGVSLRPPAIPDPASIDDRTAAVRLTTAAPAGAAAAAKTGMARAGTGRERPTAGPDGAAADAGTLASGRFWALQLNLCNSGLAGCYRGGNAVYEGGDLVFYLRPVVVTLNEICSDDIGEYLQPSLAEAWPGDWTYAAFMPAWNNSTNAPYKCADGNDFGNAVMGRIPAASYQGVEVWGGRYAAQDSSAEHRTFVCAYAKDNHFGCATHLTQRSEPVALAQCRALMLDAVPHLKSISGSVGRTVVGGDFNLEYDTSDPENVQHCVPPGHTRKGDTDVQHVIFSNDVAFAGTRRYWMLYTDRVGFLVRLTMP